MSADFAILHPIVLDALRSSGLAFEPLACEEHLADTAQFCAHYGIAPDEACNSLVVVVKKNPKEYVACLVRADTKLDVNHKLAAEIGFKRLSFATAEETAALSGQSLGGVAVIGLPTGWPLLVDQRVMEKEHVIVGGGNRTSKVRLAPAQLLKLPDSRVADLAIPRE